MNVVIEGKKYKLAGDIADELGPNPDKCIYPIIWLAQDREDGGIVVYPYIEDK